MIIKCMRCLYEASCWRGHDIITRTQTARLSIRDGTMGMTILYECNLSMAVILHRIPDTVVVCMEGRLTPLHPSCEGHDQTATLMMAA